MTYTDLAVGIGLFLFFFSLVLMISIMRFSNIPVKSSLEEFREKAVDLFGILFGSKGLPTNWEETSQRPSQLGLITDLYRIPIYVKETNATARINEPVMLLLTFDENCINKAWNDTIRVYDEDFNEFNFTLSDAVFCTNQYLNQSYLTFNVTIAASKTNRYYVYYSSDSGIPPVNYTFTYNTNSWQPNDGDSWSDSTNSWSNYGGIGASVSPDTTDKKRGSMSIKIQGSFDSTKLGLEYNPSSITGVSNGWYIDSWLYVDDLTGLRNVNISISDGNNIIFANISSGMSSDSWYHLERELTSSLWSNWTTFNAANGIDFVRIYMENSTVGLTRTIKADELHFELKPLDVKDYPEEHILAVSRKKVSALGNLTLDELREAIGGNYRFRVEISG